MKKIFHILLLSVLLAFTSCQVRVADQKKPLLPNSLELYHRYTIQTNDGQIRKVQVLRTDDQNIYGKAKGEDLIIAKKDVHQIKKFDLLSTLGIAAVAVVLLIAIPI